MPTFSQSPEGINLSSINNIQSPFSTLDDDDCDDDDNNLNSTAKGPSQSGLYTIKTKFNPLKDRKVKVNYSNDNCNSFTQKERKFAMKATHCDSLEDLSQKVGDFYPHYYWDNSNMKVLFSLENSYKVGRKLEEDI